jgi:hypothetical protein
MTRIFKSTHKLIERLSMILSLSLFSYTLGHSSKIVGRLDDIMDNGSRK